MASPQDIPGSLSRELYDNAIKAVEYIVQMGDSAGQAKQNMQFNLVFATDMANRTMSPAEESLNSLNAALALLKLETSRLADERADAKKAKADADELTHNLSAFI